jgi:hypothetical protein
MSNRNRSALRTMLAAPLAAALLLGSMYAAAPASAEAVDAQLDFKETFYSDATRTQVVGYKLYYCDNDIVSSGYETPWYTIYEYPACA